MKQIREILLIIALFIILFFLAKYSISYFQLLKDRVRNRIEDSQFEILNNAERLN